MKKLALAVALFAFVGAAMAHDGKEDGKGCCSKKATASCCKDKAACQDTKAAARVSTKTKSTSAARKAA
ncbi:MAG: hypothetical protein U0Y10_13755 [Spirosomataceae bacterium]